jgi:hypothetical protein
LPILDVDYKQIKNKQAKYETDHINTMEKQKERKKEREK